MLPSPLPSPAPEPRSSPSHGSDAHATPSPSSRCGSLPGPPAAMIYELQTALQGHVLALGALSGTYTSIYMRTPNDGGGYDGPGDGGDI